MAAGLAAVRARIAAACAAAGRSPDAVRLVAVTKAAAPARAALLPGLGQLDLAENRLPAALARQDQIEERCAPLKPRWHFIGHLQRNKVARLVGRFPVFHALDSLRLATALDEATRGHAPLEVYLEVKVSGEAAKEGLAPAQAEALLAAAEVAPGLRVAGWMTMAPLGASPDGCRQVFGALRELRDRLGAARAPGLSMGMSADLEAAVAEGATVVRVGSALLAGGAGT